MLMIYTIALGKGLYICATKQSPVLQMLDVLQTTCSSLCVRYKTRILYMFKVLLGIYLFDSINSRG